MTLPKLSLCVICLVILTSCSHEAELEVSEGIVPNPKLPPPETSLIPTVNIAAATRWAYVKTRQEMPLDAVVCAQLRY